MAVCNSARLHFFVLVKMSFVGKFMLALMMENHYPKGENNASDAGT
jgi:hypothetical protein